jgi:hypothetical protein
MKAVSVKKDDHRAVGRRRLRIGDELPEERRKSSYPPTRLPSMKT